MYANDLYTKRPHALGRLIAGRAWAGALACASTAVAGLAVVGPLSSANAAQLVVSKTYARKPPASLVKLARKENTLIWYDSTPAAGATAVMQAFQKAYPFVKHVEHVQLRDTDAATRLIQESASGTRTADVILTDPETLPELEQRHMLRNYKWGTYGVPTALTPGASSVNGEKSYAVTTTGSITAIVYNKNQLSGSQIPTSWTDLLGSRFGNGKIGIWSNAGELVALYAAWGPTKAGSYFKQLFAQKPTLYATGGAQVVDAVQSGEIPIGIAAQTTITPAIQQGAPIGMVVPSPVPLSPLDDSVTTKGKDPYIGALFTAWLDTKAGAAALATANSRTNPFLPHNSASALLKGKALAMFSISQATAEDLDATSIQNLMSSDS